MTLDGIDPDDEKTIHYIENARDVEPKDQCEKLMELCCMVAALQPDPDHEFEFDAASPSARPSSAKAEHKLEFDSQGGSSFGASPPSAKVLSPAFDPASPPHAAAAASSSAAAPSKKAETKHGRPPVKAAAGKAAQDDLRKSERLKSRHKLKEAEELLKKRIEEEGATISSPYAAKQAKALANQLFAIAGGAANAQKVLGKLALLPEVRALEVFDEHNPLKDRCIPALLPRSPTTTFQTRRATTPIAAPSASRSSCTRPPCAW